MSLTVLGALRWWAREVPDRLALNVDGAAVTYSGLFEWARRVGARLVEEGLKPGERIGVLASQSVEYFALAVGAQMMGAIVVPLNTRFTERELSVAFSDTTPVLLFAQADFFKRAQGALKLSGGPRLLPFEQIGGWRASEPTPLSFDPQPDTLFALMSTSGTTAKPKFVTFNHEMIIAVALELQLIEPTTRLGKAMLFAPPFSGGLYSTFEYLTIGCSCFLQSEFKPEVVLDLIQREGITLMPASPIFLERIAALPAFETANLRTITWATVGGARVSQQLVKKYRDKGVMLRVLFGQTEAGAAWATTGAALEDPMQSGYGGPFTDWMVIRNDGTRAPPGEVGEICIRSRSMTRGYWNNPEATAQILQDGWLHTGDLGFMNDEGSLTFVDRMKDIIISGGLNVSPAEIEQVISEVDGVDEVAVISAADVKFGETPLAVIRASKRLEPACIIEHCNRNLANYKVPRYVVFEDAPLPRNASGKISKPILREKYSQAAAQSLTRLR